MADGETELAGTALAAAVPESPDNPTATVAGTIGVALDLLDQILSGHHNEAPAGIGTRTRLPKGHWVGERAARDVLDLARKGRAFATLDSLIRRKGSPAVQSGASLALAATIQAWSELTGEPVDQITPVVFSAE